MKNSDDARTQIIPMTSKDLRRKSRNQRFRVYPVLMLLVVLLVGLVFVVKAKADDGEVAIQVIGPSNAKIGSTANYQVKILNKDTKILKVHPYLKATLDNGNTRPAHKLVGTNAKQATVDIDGGVTWLAYLRPNQWTTYNFKLKVTARFVSCQEAILDFTELDVSYYDEFCTRVIS